MELKTQKGGGTTDEKLPFTALNILQNYPCKTVLILESSGFRKGAVGWCKTKTNDKLVKVCDFANFECWHTVISLRESNCILFPLFFLFIPTVAKYA